MKKFKPEARGKMKVGIPREIEKNESRVAMVPQALGELVRLGVEVLVNRKQAREFGVLRRELASFRHILQEVAA